MNSQQRVLVEKEEAIVAAYYRCSNKKTLIEEKIIRQEGSLLGSGKGLKLTNEFNRGLFKTVNTERFLELNVGISEKPKVLSSHPLDSYYFVKTDNYTYLKITDPTKFWSAARYLVIVTDY